MNFDIIKCKYKSKTYIGIFDFYVAFNKYFISQLGYTVLLIHNHENSNIIHHHSAKTNISSIFVLIVELNAISAVFDSSSLLKRFINCMYSKKTSLRLTNPFLFQIINLMNNHNRKRFTERSNMSSKNLRAERNN